MAMFNDLFQLLADIPLTLVTAWAVWGGAGVLLVMWFRRVQYEVALPAPRPAAKSQAVSRPSSSPDLHATVAHAADTAAPERSKPVVVGDPFGDLATLLDQPAAVAAEPAPAATRAPADSPILSSAGSPIRPQVRHRLDADHA